MHTRQLARAIDRVVTEPWAPDPGFEPGSRGSEPRVLPLDESGSRRTSPRRAAGAPGARGAPEPEEPPVRWLSSRTSSGSVEDPWASTRVPPADRASCGRRSVRDADDFAGWWSWSCSRAETDEAAGRSIQARRAGNVTGGSAWCRRRPPRPPRDRSRSRGPPSLATAIDVVNGFLARRDRDRHTRASPCAATGRCPARCRSARSCRSPRSATPSAGRPCRASRWSGSPGRP